MEGSDMIRFEKDRFIIEVYTGTNPIEDYLDLQKSILNVFSIINEDAMPAGGLYDLANLLQAMQPDFDTAKKMTGK